MNHQEQVAKATKTIVNIYVIMVLIGLLVSAVVPSKDIVHYATVMTTMGFVGIIMMVVIRCTK